MRPWIVWGVGLLAYVVVILDATAFGVSGLDAVPRFGVSPGVLPSFVVLQVGAFTAMQIPAGVLLDRFGPKAMIACGVAVMSTAVLVLGFTQALPVALGSSAGIGLGDACVFISVIRLLPNWFAPSRVPLLAQLTVITGQLGQVLSAWPFLAILLHHGWTAAYLSAAALGVLSVCLTLALGRDTPSGTRPVAETGRARLAFGSIRTAWSRPGTRLGFFAHMGSQVSLATFVLMWGVPYLTIAQGFPRSVAGAMLMLPVATTVVAGVLVGMVSGRYPHHRPTMALVAIAGIAAIWTVVLAVPSPAPRWLIVMLIVAISLGLPVAIVAFDLARTFNPPETLGTAQGIINTGGFCAALLVMQAMGVVINATGGYTPTAFRLAWALQYIVWGIAATGVVVAARRVRAADPRRPRLVYGG